MKNESNRDLLFEKSIEIIKENAKYIEFRIGDGVSKATLIIKNFEMECLWYENLRAYSFSINRNFFWDTAKAQKIVDLLISLQDKIAEEKAKDILEGLKKQ